MKTYFTSDQHFNHKNVIAYCNRPYSSVEQMNEDLIARWNGVVNQEDTVYCLGDFSLNFRTVTEIAPQLNGTKYLIPGNHDECCSTKHKAEARVAKWIEKYSQYFIVCKEQMDYITLPITLSHLPYDCFDGRYPEYHPKDIGKWLLHGHVHQNWKVKGRQINVGVDVWDYTPVLGETLKEIMGA